MQTLEHAKTEPGVTRRRLVSGAAATLAATVLAQVAPIKWPARLLEEASATEADLVRDTVNGLIAFIVPGNDSYSRARGTRVRGPGGIGAGATEPLLELLDFVVSDSEGNPVPTSGALATLLNSAAQRVSPNAARDGFQSPFARLSLDQKRKAYRSMETDPGLVTGRAIVARLPAVVGLIVYSESAVLDRETGRMRGTPVGWRVSGYGGPSDGYPEFRGYYRGRRKARR